MTLPQFNTYFELPIGGARKVPNRWTLFTQTEFWNQLTGHKTFDTRVAKSSAIFNPCFRYMHRVMSNTIFGRGESDGAVRQTELFFLDAMLTGLSVDTGAFMVKHMEHAAKANKGNIVFGGIITSLAKALRYSVNNLDECTGNPRLDLDVCKNMHMIEKQGEQYYLLVRGANYRILLPDYSRTDIADRTNWSYPARQWESDAADQLAREEELGLHTDTVQPSDMPEPATAAYGPSPPPAPPSSSSTPTMNDIYRLMSDMHTTQQHMVAMQERQDEWLQSQDVRIDNVERLVQDIHRFYVAQHPAFPPPPP